MKHSCGFVSQNSNVSHRNHYCPQNLRTKYRVSNCTHNNIIIVIKNTVHSTRTCIHVDKKQGSKHKTRNTKDNVLKHSPENR